MNRIIYLTVALLLCPNTADAHHSFAEFDQTVTEEYEGEITEIFWRNPHVRLSIRTEDESGNEVIWRMEAQDLNTLGRIGVARDSLEVGQHVRFAGWPSSRQANYMALTHLLMDDNSEIVMRKSMDPRWSTTAVAGGGDITNDPKITADNDAKGLFRVWSFLRNTRAGFTTNPPLTESARLALEAFDPVTDDPVLNCVMPGMPEAITFIGPHPVEFIDQGDQITLRIESDDVVRVIHMSDQNNADSQSLSPLGYSVGHWENDNTLVVTTTKVNWPYTKLNGLVAVPQTSQSEFVERFTISSDQQQLSYTFSISDPTVFTETVTAENYTIWRWLPGAVIEPYECTLE